MFLHHQHLRLCSHSALGDSVGISDAKKNTLNSIENVCIANANMAILKPFMCGDLSALYTEKCQKIHNIYT